MAYIYDQPTLTGGIDEQLIEVAAAVPSFPIGILFFVWGVVFLGGSASQKTKNGYADTPMWAMMASLSTLIITLLMSLSVGVINIMVLGIVVSITVLSGLWFFLSKGKGEI